MNTVKLVFFLQALVQRVTVSFLRINLREFCVVLRDFTGHDKRKNCLPRR